MKLLLVILVSSYILVILSTYGRKQKTSPIFAHSYNPRRSILDSTLDTSSHSSIDTMPSPVNSASRTRSGQIYGNNNASAKASSSIKLDIKKLRKEYYDILKEINELKETVDLKHNSNLDLLLNVLKAEIPSLFTKGNSFILIKQILDDATIALIDYNTNQDLSKINKLIEELI